MTKQAVITGGARGIGAAIATLLASEGYRVGILDSDEAAVRAACRETGAIALPCDITIEQQVVQAFDAFAEIPDLVVNNAAISRFGALADQSVELFESVLRVNLIGAFIVSREAVRRMLPRGRGHVVSITSTNAYSPGVLGGAYPASKAALLQLTKQFALEYGEHGLRFNSIAPGFVDGGMSTPIYADPRIRQTRTNGVPLKRLARPEDVAHAVLMLDSEHSSYITGVDLLVDGGLTHAVLKNLPRR